MRKALKQIGICFLLVLLFWGGTLLSDRQKLREELIRLHVVANSDSEEDQLRKLLVRDAVMENLEQELKNIADVRQAREYLQARLPYIREIAEKTLQAMGCGDTAEVSLCREAFDTREYDSFTLPAGVYHALRIVIGEGSGKNWWCVVFPSLCVSVTSEDFADTAAGAGFSDGLSDTLTEKEDYQLRFGILDLMGKVENILFAG